MHVRENYNYREWETPEFLSALEAVIKYNPDDGLFRWIIPPSHGYGGSIAIGDVAGSKNPDRHVGIKVLGRGWKAHVLAWLLMTGKLPSSDQEIDHIDRNRSNNRWNNLRLVKRGRNIFNSGRHTNNTSGVTGVVWINRRWSAYIDHDGKRHGLGDFAEFNDAVMARRNAEIEHYGEHKHRDPLPEKPLDGNPATGRKIDRVANVRETWSDPALRAKQGRTLSAYLATPEGRAQRSATSTIVNAREDVREKHRQNTSNLIWITDGVHNSRIQRDAEIPEGWRRGRTVNAAHFKSKAGVRKSITNGTENRSVTPDTVLPEGWRWGMCWPKRVQKETHR